MSIDPWKAFDRLVMGGPVKLKPTEIKSIEAKFSEERLLCMDGFAPVAAQLAAGNIDRYSVGESIFITSKTGTEVEFIIIGKNHDGDNTLTAQTKRAFSRVKFCGERRGHPFGWNHPEHNDIRPWFNQTYAPTFSQQDLDCLKVAEKTTRLSNEDGGNFIVTNDLFFCLSASEAGFEVDDEYVYDEGAAYEFYADGLYEKRMKVDFSDKPRNWWLRSPYPSSASGVRSVKTDGSLDYNRAHSSYAVAPACVIKAKRI